MSTVVVDLIDKVGGPGQRALRSHGLFDFEASDDGSLARGVPLDVAEEMARLFPGRFLVDSRTLGLPHASLAEVSKLAGQVAEDGEERSLGVKTADGGMIIVTVTPGSEDLADGPDDGQGKDVEASAAAVALAQEHDVRLSDVPGTGKGGSVTKADVQRYLKDQPADGPAEE